MPLSDTREGRSANGLPLARPRQCRGAAVRRSNRLDRGRRWRLDLQLQLPRSLNRAGRSPQMRCRRWSMIKRLHDLPARPSCSVMRRLRAFPARCSRFLHAARCSVRWKNKGRGRCRWLPSSRCLAALECRRRQARRNR